MASKLLDRPEAKRPPGRPLRQPTSATADSPPRSWRERFRDAPAWAFSVAVHGALLVVLASIPYVAAHGPDVVVIDSIFDDLQNERQFEMAVSEIVGNDSDLEQSPNSAASAQRIGDNPQTNIEPELLDDVTPKFDLPESPSDAMNDLLGAVDIRGANTVTPGGVKGAMDLLTHEIANSLRDRKTLVVWLFDASGSLVKRRKAIAERFDNVYKQLGQIDAAKDNSLTTAVVSFGKQTKFLTPEPVTDVSRLKNAILDIKMDRSGKENVFGAVQEIVGKFYKYKTKGNRNIRLIVVTDERGDDLALVEKAIFSAHRYRIKCYVVGNAATFGREHGYYTWTFSDGSTKVYLVDQGPETVRPERLRLAFWGSAGRGKLRNDVLDRKLSSGYGPNALTRLCSETGGVYLITSQPRGPKFDPALMRGYSPEYIPIADYDRKLSQNKAKSALVRAATQTSVEEIQPLQLVFRADSENALRIALTEAQKPAAKLEAKLNEMLKILRSGEADRPKIREPRWQAGFDLAIGRVLAMKVRYLGYNEMHAEMKRAPKKFQKKGSNQWRLKPSDEVHSGASTRKDARAAEKFLKRVVDDHADTPWGLLAERELAQPFGWSWYESTGNYAPARRRGNQPTGLQRREMRRRQEVRRREAPDGL